MRGLPARIAYLAVVLMIVVGAFAYINSHADQEPGPDSGPGPGPVSFRNYSSQTFAQTPAFPATGSGADVPPTVDYTINSPLRTILSVELHSDSFTWVPAIVAGAARANVDLVRYSGGCPGKAAPGMTCPTLWQAQYTLAAAGPVTIFWDLLAEPSPTAEIGIDTPVPTGPPAPGQPCPAHLPVPLTPAVEGCVVARAVITVDVSSAPAVSPSTVASPKS